LTSHIVAFGFVSTASPEVDDRRVAIPEQRLGIDRRTRDRDRGEGARSSWRKARVAGITRDRHVRRIREDLARRASSIPGPARSSMKIRATGVVHRAHFVREPDRLSRPDRRAARARQSALAGYARGGDVGVHRPGSGAAIAIPAGAGDRSASFAPATTELWNAARDRDPPRRQPPLRRRARAPSRSPRSCRTARTGDGELMFAITTPSTPAISGATTEASAATAAIVPGIRGRPHRGCARRAPWLRREQVGLGHRAGDAQRGEASP